MSGSPKFQSRRAYVKPTVSSPLAHASYTVEDDSRRSTSVPRNVDNHASQDQLKGSKEDDRSDIMQSRVGIDRRTNTYTLGSRSNAAGSSRNDGYSPPSKVDDLSQKTLTVSYFSGFMDEVLHNLGNSTDLIDVYNEYERPAVSANVDSSAYSLGFTDTDNDSANTVFNVNNSSNSEQGNLPAPFGMKGASELTVNTSNGSNDGSNSKLDLQDGLYSSGSEDEDDVEYICSDVREGNSHLQGQKVDDDDDDLESQELSDLLSSSFLRKPATNMAAMAKKRASKILRSPMRGAVSHQPSNFSSQTSSAVNSPKMSKASSAVSSTVSSPMSPNMPQIPSGRSSSNSHTSPSSISPTSRHVPRSPLAESFSWNNEQQSGTSTEKTAKQDNIDDFSSMSLADTMENAMNKQFGLQPGNTGSTSIDTDFNFSSNTNIDELLFSDKGANSKAVKNGSSGNISHQRCKSTPTLSESLNDPRSGTISSAITRLNTVTAHEPLPNTGNKLSETFEKVIPSWFLPPFVVNPRTFKILLVIDEIYRSEVRFWGDTNKALLFYVKPMINESDSKAIFEGIAEMYVMSSGILNTVKTAMHNVTDESIDDNVNNLVAETVSVLKATYKKYSAKLCQSLWTAYSLLNESKNFREFVAHAQVQSSLALYNICMIPFDRLNEWKTLMERLSDIEGLDSIALRAQEIKRLDKDMLYGQTNAAKLMQILVQVEKIPVPIVTCPGQVLRISEPVDLIQVNTGKRTITGRKLGRLYLLRNELIIVKVITDASQRNKDFDLKALYDISPNNSNSNGSVASSGSSNPSSPSSSAAGSQNSINSTHWNVWKGNKWNRKPVFKVVRTIPLNSLYLKTINIEDGERGKSILEVGQISLGKVKNAFQISCICEKYRNQWVDFCEKMVIASK